VPTAVLSAEVVDAQLLQTGRVRSAGQLVRTRRYVMAYNRWLAGQRRWKPSPAHYEISREEAARALKTMRFDKVQPPNGAAL
jgi:hypothetical protein